RVTLSQQFHVAVLGYNLIDRHSPITPVLVGGSASFGLGTSLTVGGDVFADLSTFNDTKLLAGGGIEYLVGGSFPLRLGYRQDTGRDIGSLSGGLGYVNEHVGIDFAIRKDLSGDDELKLLFGLRYQIQ